MHAWNRLKISAFSFLLVLAVSAMAVQPALADSSTPPPPAPSTGSGPASPTGNNSPSKVPAGTDVVVLDKSGNSVPLASQKAAQIVASGDPIWCPKGVAPRPSVGGCSAGFTGFTFISASDYGLNTWLSNNHPAKAGAIWIADGYNSQSIESGMTNLTLDGSTLANMSNFSLDINGGWNGMAGSKTINTNSPSVFDIASVDIIHWHAPITISDIVVTGVTTNPYEQYALSVQTDKGGITLNRVQVIDNYNPSISGAHLDTLAATLGHPAPVTVNDSVFNHNYGNGLVVLSDGAVKIRNLTADYNGTSSTYGAYIGNNLGDNPNQPVTLTGTNEFKYNRGNGLWIDSNGTVTLNNITAYHNDDGSGTGYGVAIINSYDSTPSTVKLTGTNLLTYNAQDGLAIKSNGNISVNNITSTDNSESGAYLDNCLNSGTFTACPTTGKTVTLTGLNTFNGNTGNDGLIVYSSGAIKISQVTANDNSGNGVLLDNCAPDAPVTFNCHTPLPYNVTLTNASTFTGNVSDGLNVKATGTVSLKNITAGFNGVNGVKIYNAAHLLAARPVTISGTNVFKDNYQFGLFVLSYGAIKLSNATANDNGQTATNGTGVYLNNEGYDSSVSGATVITRMPVSLTGVNNFDHNYSGGLYVYSVGAITASNVSASNNGSGSSGDGVFLYNTDNWYPNFGVKTPYAANATISGFGTFESNVNNGLSIGSSGAVKLANLTAEYNGATGAGIGAWDSLAPQSVTLTGMNTFNENGYVTAGDGLYIQNSGKITISNLSAKHNELNGAYLDNFTSKLPGKFLGVTLTGFNTFLENQGSYGLFIATDGSATMSHINADRTMTGTGVYVNATKNVTLMCASAFGNSGYGFDLTSLATMTLTGVHAYENGVPEILSYPVNSLHRTSVCP